MTDSAAPRPITVRFPIGRTVAVFPPETEVLLVRTGHLPLSALQGAALQLATLPADEAGEYHLPLAEDGEPDSDDQAVWDAAALTTLGEVDPAEVNRPGTALLIPGEPGDPIPGRVLWEEAEVADPAVLEAAADAAGKASGDASFLAGEWTAASALDAEATIRAANGGIDGDWGEIDIAAHLDCEHEWMLPAEDEAAADLQRRAVAVARRREGALVLAMCDEWRAMGEALGDRRTVPHPHLNTYILASSRVTVVLCPENLVGYGMDSGWDLPWPSEGEGGHIDACLTCADAAHQALEAAPSWPRE